MIPLSALSVVVVLLSADSAFAAPAEPAASSSPEAETAEIHRRLDILSQEIERLKVGDAGPAPDEIPYIGYGPSASKVYRSAQKNVSLGGYGEMLYQNYDSSTDAGGATSTFDQIDFLRGVLYVGYRFNDSFLFNSEYEFEHASTGVAGGEVSVEFAYLDWLAHPSFNVRAGLLLIPMGLLNELHEPTTFLGSRRTETESLIIPTTWRENGAGFFGDIGNFSYRTYLTNGMNSGGFSASSLRSGRQKGSNAKVQGGDWAWTARVDYVGSQGLLLGASMYLGDSGYYGTPTAIPIADVRTRIYEAHADWKRGGLELRALGAVANLGNVASLNTGRGLTGAASVGEKLWGAYLQAGYDVLAGSQQAVIPFVRWERLHTQADVPAGYAVNGANLFTVRTYGVTYKPIESIAVKVDYQDFDRSNGSGVDQVNAALGFNF